MDLLDWLDRHGPFLDRHLFNICGAFACLSALGVIAAIRWIV